jgi:hypothetical protein
VIATAIGNGLEPTGAGDLLPVVGPLNVPISKPQDTAAGEND